MIFVSGIHGVGKDFFLSRICNRTGLKSYSASELISKYGNVNFRSDKRTQDISKNQDYLLQAIRNGNLPKEYILNGHFCLLNNNGKSERIPIGTFYSLNPSKIIVLKQKPEIIVGRRIIRDLEEVSVEETRAFQNEEINYGREVAKKLNVPIAILDSAKDIEKAIDFIFLGKDKNEEQMQL